MKKAILLIIFLTCISPYYIFAKPINGTSFVVTDAANGAKLKVNYSCPDTNVFQKLNDDFGVDQEKIQQIIGDEFKKISHLNYPSCGAKEFNLSICIKNFDEKESSLIKEGVAGYYQASNKTMYINMNNLDKCKNGGCKNPYPACKILLAMN